MKKVRKWDWAPFENPARTDGAVFHHWKRVTDEPKEYPFAKFNKQLSIPSYTLNEYTTHLKTNANWTKVQTDHLFDLAKRFDIRFIIMADRWDRDAHGIKTVDELKERYYEVAGILQKLKNGGGTEKKVYTFDIEHEKKRKEQLQKLFERSQSQIDEEAMLLNEMRKIEARKKEREKKTQDLQKLISQADQQVDQSSNTPTARKQDKKLNKKKVQAQNQRPSRIDAAVGVVESAGIKFADLRGTGVSLRSQKMKLPANVGQKKAKALEQLLQEFKVGEYYFEFYTIVDSFTDFICFNRS
jgi:DNA methyltransferase 1-associated protein 1